MVFFILTINLESHFVPLPLNLSPVRGNHCSYFYHYKLVLPNLWTTYIWNLTACTLFMHSRFAQYHVLKCIHVVGVGSFYYWEVLHCMNVIFLHSPIDEHLLFSVLENYKVTINLIIFVNFNNIFKEQKWYCSLYLLLIFYFIDYCSHFYHFLSSIYFGFNLL